MKKYIKHLIIIMWLLCNISIYAQSHKRNFTYAYDGMGNRISRTYALLACPSCRTTKQDSTKVTDSIFAIAQTTIIELPQTPTEKVTYDISIELRNIYPNPTQGNFVVQFTDIVSNATVQIIDMQGNKLDEQILSGSQWQLDISLFPAGNYILIIRTQEGKAYNKKIIKI